MRSSSPNSSIEVGKDDAAELCFEAEALAIYRM